MSAVKARGARRTGLEEPKTNGVRHVTPRHVYDSPRQRGISLLQVLDEIERDERIEALPVHFTDLNMRHERCHRATALGTGEEKTLPLPSV